METQPLLEINNLHVHYKIYTGILRVLNGVKFTVGAREKVGVIGEAGCGRTTIMKTILRVLPQNAIVPKPEGKVLFEGKNILKMNNIDLQNLRREKISMIFQDPTSALNPVFKVGTQIMDVIKATHMSRGEKSPSKDQMKRMAIEILKEVALPDPKRILENYPIMLSGGMRQRICIAMAVISGKKMLIADEPGTNLDVTIQDQILRLLDGLVTKQGTSIILVSHALGAVRGLVDRVYTMYAGSMIEVAKTKDLFAEALHPYTVGLLRAVPRLTGEGISKGIPGRIPSYINPPKGCRFHPRCKYTMPICRMVKPPFYDTGDGHQVACHLYEE